MLNREFYLQPSKTFLLLMMVCFVAAAVIVLTSSFICIIKIMLLIMLITYVFYIGSRYVLLRSSKSILIIKRHSDGHWQLNTSHHETFAWLIGDSTVTRFVCVLRFKFPGHFFLTSSIIFFDSLSNDEYRRLLMLLRGTTINY